jgi:hypothetical protein
MDGFVVYQALTEDDGMLAFNPPRRADWKMSWDTILVITGMLCGIMWALNRRKSR